MKSMAMIIMLLLGFALSARAQQFRPPAIPLVVYNPYFSIWSMSDNLTDDMTRHWTGTPQALVSLVRINGKTYRIMGNEPRDVPALKQKSVRVLPTRTIYDFTGAGFNIQLTFMTPDIASGINLLSRPVTYITWSAKSTDGRTYDTAIYFSASGRLAVNSAYQKVNASRLREDGRTILRIGSTAQPILQKQGDDLRIDWGYLYAVPGSEQQVKEAIADERRALREFTSSGEIPNSIDFELPCAAGGNDGPALVFRYDLGNVGVTPVHRYMLLAYDELYSIRFLNRRLLPYWRRNGASITELINTSIHDYIIVNAKCQSFDDAVMADMKKLGGEKYALLTALAYRQSLGAQTLAANYDGQPLLFPKENSSNGDISTVDVIYPDSPLLLLLNPALAKASIMPVLEYVASGRWPFPWAPHDLRQYPHADGYIFPPNVSMKSSNGVMPIEETGKMIILGDAIARISGSTSMAKKYWPHFVAWAKYLRANGLNLTLQLSSDEFSGAIAHNANLSAKAIVGLGAFAQLCDQLRKHQEAMKYRAISTQYAREWMEMDADGNHYCLAFDRPGTYSLVYNLLWNSVLKLNIFPSIVAQKEVVFYMKHQNPYGMPLDSRTDLTKIDWLSWCASMAKSKADFEALIDPAYEFADRTPDRVPPGDLYHTKTAIRRGFKARSVVGGLYMKALTDPAMWHEWAAKTDSTKPIVIQYSN